VVFGSVWRTKYGLMMALTMDMESQNKTKEVNKKVGRIGISNKGVPSMTVHQSLTLRRRHWRARNMRKIPPFFQFSRDFARTLSAGSANANPE
jgi:hypothetical protein